MNDFIWLQFAKINTVLLFTQTTGATAAITFSFAGLLADSVSNLGLVLFQRDNANVKGNE
jgi:hypothetical protein